MRILINKMFNSHTIFTPSCNVNYLFQICFNFLLRICSPFTRTFFCYLLLKYTIQRFLNIRFCTSIYWFKWYYYRTKFYQITFYISYICCCCISSIHIYIHTYVYCTLFNDYYLFLSISIRLLCNERTWDNFYVIYQV